MKQSYTDEINKVINQFKGDIDSSAIPAEISIYQTIFEDVQVINFQEIVKHLQTIPHVERSLMPNILILVKLLLVSGATSATPERSFSLAIVTEILVAYKHFTAQIQLAGNFKLS